MTFLHYQGLANTEHGGNIEAAKIRYGRTSFLDLSININPWGPPIQLWLIVLANLAKLQQYPQPHASAGCEILAEFFDLKTDQIVLGNGAAELIRRLPYALPVKRAVVLEPTFSEYGQAFLAAGKPVLTIPLSEDFQIPWQKLAQSLYPQDLLFICQPNNPTGAIFNEEDLLRILELVRAKQCLCAIDESFLWFAGDLRKLSFYRHIQSYSNLILINSLTKIGSIPGLRLGFIVTNREIAKLITGNLDQWNVNWLAQKVIPTILNSGFLMKTRVCLAAENEWLKSQFTLIPGIRVFPWITNFYLGKVVDPQYQKGKLIRRLGEQGVLVRDCNNFSGLGADYFRAAVGTRRQNKEFIKTLRRILY